jgi:NAD-dependent DNA ligase
LAKWGFPVNPLTTLRTRKLEALIDHYNEIGRARRSPYDIDGVVYKVDRLDLQERLGFRLAQSRAGRSRTSSRPRRPRPGSPPSTSRSAAPGP